MINSIIQFLSLVLFYFGDLDYSLQVPFCRVVRGLGNHRRSRSDVHVDSQLLLARLPILVLSEPEPQIKQTNGLTTIK